MSHRRFGTPHLWFGSRISQAAPIENIDPACLFYKIAIGKKHCSIVSLDGSVYAFGNNQYGQLGLGDVDDEFRQYCLLKDFKSILLFFVDCVFYVSPDYFLSVDFVYLINIAI